MLKTSIKEEKRAAADSRPWLHGREFFCELFRKFLRRIFLGVFRARDCFEPDPEKGCGSLRHEKRAV
jgi:hypothetical protein